MKYRRPVLVAPMVGRLKAIIRGVCGQSEVRLVETEVMPDHVHLALASVEPQIGIHRVVAEIKRQTSRLLRYEFRELRTKLPTLWTRSYFVARVGSTPNDVMKR